MGWSSIAILAVQRKVVSILHRIVRKSSENLSYHGSSAPVYYNRPHAVSQIHLSCTYIATHWLFLEFPAIRQTTSPGACFVLRKSFRNMVHSSQMIFEIVTSAKLLPITAAAFIHTLPVLAWNFVNTFFMPLAIVWSCKALCSRTIFESTMMSLEMFLLMLEKLFWRAWSMLAFWASPPIRVAQMCLIIEIFPSPIDPMRHWVIRRTMMRVVVEIVSVWREGRCWR